MFSIPKLISDEQSGLTKRGLTSWFSKLKDNYFSSKGLKELWSGNSEYKVRLLDDTELNKIANVIKENKNLGKSAEALFLTFLIENNFICFNRTVK